VAKAKKPTPKSSKKFIAQYEHADKTRKNNPPVGLVMPDTDRKRPHCGHREGGHEQ
jgi:hypothetical protein